MILAIKIMKHDLAYASDIKECLVHNSSNPEIEKIVVFSDFDLGIDIDSKSKKVLLLKIDLGHFKCIERSCKISRDFVIYSTPFVKFDSNLGSIRKNLNSGKVLRSPDSYYIFGKDTKLRDRSSVDEILDGIFEVPRFYFQKIGYFGIPNFPVPSLGWKISRVSLDQKVPEAVPDIVSVPERREFSVPIQSSYRPASHNIDVVIVSVDYNDFLEITLGHNQKIFDRITVVTSHSDKRCVEICEKMGVDVVITDSMYSDGAKFNKGKAINEGLASLEDPEFVLILDADIIVPDMYMDFPLEEKTIYYRDRIMLRDHESYERFMEGSSDFETESLGPIGYFQLFKYSSKLKYAESSSNAAWSDVKFIRKFRWQKKIDSPVIHLGEDKKNWSGRTTPDFKKVDVFDLNSYFDKIYCLNLDKRRDRWNKVKKEFRRFGISASRFSAIEGENMSHPDSDVIKSMSNQGLIENSNALGCLTSHIEMIKDAKAKGYNRILIFEDDILISEDFYERISLLSQMEWKIFYLGASQFDWNRIHIKEGYYRCRKTLGTFAYALDCSVYDEILEKAEGSEMSIDNILSAVQAENMKKCLTFFPNIVISDVSDSNIRIDKNMLEYSISMRWNLNRFDYPVEKVDRIKVLLVPDIRGWAFDNIAKAIIKYNPYPKKIEYDVIYVSDIISGKKFNEDEYDLIYVFFEAERCIPDGPKVIRGCYSAYWLENASISPSYLSDIFQKCAGVVFANDDLRSEINLPSNFPTITITDSADEKMFYPIELKKKDNLTAIFVGNTKRPIKRFSEIEEMCREAGVDLMVCSDIRNDELVNHYNLADICINFSDSEGGPQTFVESALCGIPMLIKSSNSLSKKIPCFTGDGKDDFVRTLKRLNSKKGKKECEKKGREARFAALKDFTYSMTAKKFSDFFIGFEESPDRVDLRNDLTVFVIRFGENPNYPDCVSALSAQNSIFRIVEISNISPMSKAFQRMIDVCETKYYIQVDEDMVLFEDSILRIYHSLSESEANIASCSFRLRDSHLDFNIYGIKGYKHDIMDRYHYNLNTISCEMEQVLRYQKDGYQMLMSTDVLGYHSPKWTNELIFERYFDLMEKWKIFKYDWLGELPAKLRELYASNPSENNFYALMGAMNSLFSSDPIRKSERILARPIFYSKG